MVRIETVVGWDSNGGMNWQGMVVVGGVVVASGWVGLIVTRMRKVGIMPLPCPIDSGVSKSVTFDASNNPEVFAGKGLTTNLPVRE